MRVTGQPRKLTPPARHALSVSFVFHALLIGMVIAAMACVRPLAVRPSGSKASAPVMSLEKMELVEEPDPPAPPAPPEQPIPLPPLPDAPTPTTIVDSPEPSVPTVDPNEGVPVFAPSPPSPSPAPNPKPPHTSSPAPAKLVRQETVAAPPPMAPTVAPTSVSTAPGDNIFPHPPYPKVARDRGETGTVLVNVEFDADGNVTRVSVAQSSGTESLDTSTCRYIQQHWRSLAHAGQSVVQPVEYALH